MLIIRLRRIGKKHQATFRFIISEKRKDTKGDFLEDLGFYDPRPSPSKIELKEERVKYWLSIGAQASDTVYNLLVNKGIIKGDKRKVWRPKKKKAEEDKEIKPEQKAEIKTETQPVEKPIKKMEPAKEEKKKDKPEVSKGASKPEPKREEKKAEPKEKRDEEKG